MATTPIFVFGSNLAGRHGKGAALSALRHHGALYGIGYGPQGNAYAIPTKDRNLKRLPLQTIQLYVNDFKAHARTHLDSQFHVTPIGTGLAGYKHADIAPMFKGTPANCTMPTEWKKWLA